MRSVDDVLDDDVAGGGVCDVDVPDGDVPTNDVAPGTVAPGAVAPDAVATGTVAPGAVSPDAVATGTVAPGAAAPGTVAIGTVAPDAVAPGAVTTSTSATGTVAPGAVATDAVDVVYPPEYIPSYDPNFPIGHHNWPDIERVKYLSSAKLTQFESALLFLRFMDSLHFVATGSYVRNFRIESHEWDEVEKANRAYYENTNYHLKDKKLLQDRYCRDAARINQFLIENARAHARQETLAALNKVAIASTNLARLIAEEIESEL